MLMCMRLSRVDVFMRFLSLVFTQFIVENERSHSAVLTGTRAAMEASFEKFGYMS